jgi:hypothetical protein
MDVRARECDEVQHVVVDSGVGLMQHLKHVNHRKMDRVMNSNNEVIVHLNNEMDRVMHSNNEVIVHLKNEMGRVMHSNNEVIVHLNHVLQMEMTML